MKKNLILLLTTCLILTTFTAGYTQETNLDTLAAADVNADGVINVLDLTIIAANFGKTVIADQKPNPDVNGDGIVNILDMTLVASHFGETVQPPVVPVSPPLFLRANPTINSQLAVDDTITLTFDNPPEDVTVSTGVAETVDKTVIITGPFNPGALALMIAWTGGTHTLNYTVRAPDTEAPQIIGGTLSDGDIDVAPAAINSNGQIVVEFNEVVSGNIALQTESGDDIGWLGSVSGKTATLELIRGKEVGHATTYVIAGKVSDAAGNETDLSITFTTIRPPVAFVSVTPTVQSPIAVDATITLTFDNTPDDVKVFPGVATITGKAVEVAGPFNPGPLALTVTWADGSQTLTYVVRTPDTEAPNIIGGTFSDGDKNVDPEKVNNSGQIEVEFNEAVSGNISLQTESGDDVGWIGKVEGKKATLTLVKGKEIGDETTYVIVGAVSDAASNSTDINITFTLRPPVAFVSARPASGATLDVDDTITLTFDERPRDVKVSAGTARTTGRSVRIRGPFDPGSLELTITWTGGNQTLTYTVRAPDTEAPKITSSTVTDGKKDVDPEKVNSSRRLEITFNETVSGDIELQTESGNDVGWIGRVTGKKAILTLAAGKEIDNGTTYVIKGKVSDAAGNSTDINITFSTRKPAAPAATGIPIEVTDATFKTLVLQSEVPVLLEYIKDG